MVLPRSRGPEPLPLPAIAQERWAQHRSCPPRGVAVQGWGGGCRCGTSLPYSFEVKLLHVPCGWGEVLAVIPPIMVEGTLCTITACTQRLPAFTNCQQDGAKIGFALWCQVPAQRMCIYFYKLHKLTEEIVPAWEEKVKHCNLILTKIHPSCGEVIKKHGD